MHEHLAFMHVYIAGMRLVLMEIRRGHETPGTGITSCSEVPRSLKKAASSHNYSVMSLAATPYL